MLNLFIDSNILLNFYDFSKEDLSNLGKLIELIKKGDFKIYVTSNLIIEVEKNRGTRLQKAFEIFKKSKISLAMPVICQAYGEYKKISRLQNELDKSKSNLSKKLEKDIQDRTLKADKIIQELFEVGQKINSEKYLEAAIKRKQLGKPPGLSDKTCGDAVNWEALLAEIPQKEILIIVSNDKTFQDPLNSEKLHPLLLKEWKEKKRSEILFYRTLTDFFNKHAKEIKLKIEKEKEMLINDLLNSPNFATTHLIIQKLSMFTEFSEEQIKALTTALINNSQVRWIATDLDVNSFYRGLLKGKETIFDKRTFEIIQNVLKGEYEPYEEIETKDIPF